MVLKSKQTMVAYRCPFCGEGVLGAVGLFSLNADMVRLKCSCGKSELEVVITPDDKVRLKVPCMICPRPHNYTVSKTLFFNRNSFMLPCPVSEFDIGFFGDLDHVRYHLDRMEIAYSMFLEENDLESFGPLHERAPSKDWLGDAQIEEIMMFVIRDLEAEGKIFCTCHPEGSHSDPSEHEYDVEIMINGIMVSCPECGASRLIPTDGLLSSHAFLNCDAIYLE